MNKKIILVLVLCLVFLGGCSTEKKLSANELFEKKQECAKYSIEIKDEVAREINANKTIAGEDLFYSPNKNSCLYSFYIFEENDSYHEYQFFIKDILSKKIIYESVVIFDFKNYGIEELKFKEKIKELKGEN